MLSGRPPFTGSTYIGLLAKHLTEPPPRPTLFCPGMPASVEALLLRSLEKDRHQRFGSMSELLAALPAITGGTAALAAAGAMVGPGALLWQAGGPGAAPMGLAAAVPPTLRPGQTQAATSAPLMTPPPGAVVPPPPAPMRPCRPPSRSPPRRRRSPPRRGGGAGSCSAARSGPRCSPPASSGPCTSTARAGSSRGATPA